MSDLNKLEKFLDDEYRASYLEGHVKGTIAYQMQALRQQEDLNQTEFGEVLGIPQSVVSRLESTEYGSVNVNTLVRIANKLKIGLEIRFCDFERVLNADVSPTALRVEKIQDTIERVQSTQSAASATPVPVVASPASSFSATESSYQWQTEIQNQPSLPVSRVSGTNNFGTFILIVPSSGLRHSI